MLFDMLWEQKLFLPKRRPFVFSDEGLIRWYANEVWRHHQPQYRDHAEIWMRQLVVEDDYALHLVRAMLFQNHIAFGGGAPIVFGSSPTTVTITTTGASTWSGGVPVGVYTLDTFSIGAGGGGIPGPFNGGDSGQGGAGGGGSSKTAGLAVVPGGTVWISNGATTAVITTGTQSWVNVVSNAAPTTTAQGSLAKGGNTPGGTSGATGGATASGVGTTKFAGGTGGNGDGLGTGQAGGGGGSAGSTANGGNGSLGTAGAGNSPGGSGGAGGFEDNGSAGTAPGGGGGSSGANSGNGGTGGRGEARITHFTAP